MTILAYLIVFFVLNTTNVTISAAAAKPASAKNTPYSMLSLINKIEVEEKNLDEGEDLSIDYDVFTKMKALFYHIIATEIRLISGEKNADGTNLKIDPQKEEFVKIIVLLLREYLKSPRTIVLYGLIFLKNLSLKKPALLKNFDFNLQYFIVSCLLASKTIEDEFYQNKGWANILYGFFYKMDRPTQEQIIKATQDTLAKINSIETTILKELDWQMVITPEQLTAFIKSLDERYNDLLESVLQVYRNIKKPAQKARSIKEPLKILAEPKRNHDPCKQSHQFQAVFRR